MKHQHTNGTNKAHSETKIDIDEYSEIASHLNQYPVEFPSEAEINRTILELSAYMPEPEGAKQNWASRSLTQELFQVVRGEMVMFHKSYWLACAVLLLLGFWLGRQHSMDSTLIVLFLVPIPFVLGLLEVFKGRDSGLMEMELTCKMTAQQLMLARLIVVLSGNIVFVFLLMLLVSNETGDLLTWKSAGLLYTQLLISAGTSLWLAMRVRGGTAVSLFLIFWFALVQFVLTLKEVKAFIETIQPSWLAVIAFVGAGLLIRQTYQMVRKYTSQTERGYSFDTDHR